MNARRPRPPHFALALALAFTDAACESPAPSSHAAAHWSYEGETGPARWGDLDQAYAQCATGVRQSPLDLVGARGEDLANVVFDYHPSALSVVNNGHTVQADYAAGSSITLEGKRYDLAQFHVHAPSEHRVAGRSFPAEVHLVHKSSDGALAVVGLLVESGAENAALAPYFANLPATAGPARQTGAQVDAGALLPSNRCTYRYVGSLTTPPCSEGVSWCVLSTPIQASASQIASFTRILNGNNRPVQPLGTRAIVQDITP
jgi:carbonic anhydrase